MAADRVDCLIFSKDRGCQLDLLLRSIDRHAAHVYSSLTVLWRASSKDYGRGYAVAFSEHASVKFILETDFEGQVRRWLSLTDGPVSFLVDDDVFYTDVVWPVIPDGYTLSDYLPFSLRGGDYDYPFSVDGNIYTKTDVAVLLHGLRFRNPTELEALGHEHRSRLPFGVVRPLPACLVGVPLNRVSDNSGMPHMGFHEYDLNERYLEGERLEIPDAPVGTYQAHAELELAFA